MGDPSTSEGGYYIGFIQRQKSQTAEPFLEYKLWVTPSEEVDPATTTAEITDKPYETIDLNAPQKHNRALERVEVANQLE